MKDCILFLNGSYKPSELAYYRDLCDGKFTVAVDGGYSFFRRTRTFPDLLIGDFDSIKAFPRNLPESTIVKRYPAQKDKTDAELALEYCLAHGARRIDIIQPSYGEPDQLLGNFLLLSLVSSRSEKRTLPKLRILNRRYEVILLDHGSVTIVDGAGDMVSVIPLSSWIRLTTSGADYNVHAARISRGRSQGLRNRIAKKRASFKIEGTALVIRQFSSRVPAQHRAHLK